VASRMITVAFTAFIFQTHEPTWINSPTWWLLGVVFVLLIIAYGVGEGLKRQPQNNINPAVLRTFILRVRAWWMMYAILFAAFRLGFTTTIILFGLVSFWALREFITMTPTRRADHRALFWVLIVFTPLQYLLVGIDHAFIAPTPGTWSAWMADELGMRGMEFYGLYSIMIPVYGSLFIYARIALSGDFKRFLERTAKIQAGLLICVYSLSHAPALLQLELMTWKPAPVIPAASGSGISPSTAPNDIQRSNPAVESRQASGLGKRPWTEGAQAGLLFYFILIVQTGDIFQYVWGKAFGRRVIVPEINASRTWEGFVGGAATTTVLGAMLWWVTPFRIYEAALMSLITAIMGFAGRLTMSAIKRDRGVTDTGTLVQGHAGVLDRIDSICFSAPVFFHLTRLFFADLS
jgi:phosphatidate cytidylyltransferase